MKDVLHRFRPLVAIVALLVSTSVAFASQPEGADLAGYGRDTAASHAGKTVPVAADEETAGEDEDAGEETDEDAGESPEAVEEDATDEVNAEPASEGSDNCSTDPTTLSAEDLAAMNHGSVVCWAAQQTEWPEWFSNHGEFVKCWAHQGKADAASCTEDPNAAADAGTQDVVRASHHVKAKGKSHKRTR